MDRIIPITLRESEILSSKSFDFFSMDLNFNGIFAYSTTSTADAAYIIGGGFHPMSQIIVEFKNGRWHRLRNLNRPRDSHGSISVDGLTMIIGGASCIGMNGCGP